MEIYSIRSLAEIKEKFELKIEQSTEKLLVLNKNSEKSTSNTVILSGSGSTKRAPWEEFQEINNKLLCELTVELCRLENLNKLDHGWLEKKGGLINGVGDGQMMMQTFQTTHAFSCTEDAAKWDK